MIHNVYMCVYLYVRMYMSMYICVNTMHYIFTFSLSFNDITQIFMLLNIYRLCKFSINCRNKCDNFTIYLND